MNRKLTIELASTQANILKRSKTLWDDGYTFVCCREQHITIYGIYKPGNADTKPDYSVFFGGELQKCSCPAFEKYDTCKHFLACEKLEAEAELKQVAEDNGIEWE